jgi:hydrogenase expression/formation protein HypE
VRDAVRGASELLGLDPLYVANEGKLVAFVEPAGAASALASLRSHPLGREAAIVGVATSRAGEIAVRTVVGGMRLVDLPLADPLPRIC